LISYSTQIGKKQDNQDLINLKKIESNNIDSYFNKIEKQINASILPEVRKISDINQEIDLIISVRYGIIFKGSIIKFPKFGIINLHSGILPNYRGVMPTFWSMLNQEKEIGCTLHYIQDQTIDTGDIIEIYRKNIDYQKSYIFNVLSIYKSGSNIILKLLKKISLKSKIIKKPQIDKGKYYSFPKKFELDKFQKFYKLFNKDDFLTSDKINSISFFDKSE